MILGDGALLPIAECGCLALAAHRQAVPSHCHALEDALRMCR